MHVCSSLFFVTWEVHKLFRRSPLAKMCEDFAAPALVHTSAGQWAPTIYKTSRRPSLVSKFGVVAEKSSRKSTLHCEMVGAEDVLGGLQWWDGKYDFSANRTSFKTIFRVRTITGALLFHCIKIRRRPYFFPPMYPGMKK